MKKLTYIYMSFLFLLFSCSEKKVKQIPLMEGLVSNFNKNEILLFNHASPKIPIDTIKMDEGGTFSIPKQAISQAGFYYLQFSSESKLNFFLKPSDYVNISLDAENPLESCKSNNSKFLTTLWKLEKNTNKFKNEIEAITNVFGNINNEVFDEKMYLLLYNKKDSIIDIYKENSLDIAESFKSPIIDFVMLNQKASNVSIFNIQPDLQLFLNNAEQLMADEQLKPLFEEYDRQIMHAYTAIRAEERYHKGGKFPKLKAKTNWNEEVTLAQLSGNPIHVIFWSGRDLLDDTKIKQTKQLMKKFGYKGLKTLMVAYSKDKEEWLNRIKLYRLPYWHLIDTSSIQSIDLIEMGVRSLPCNFVVDSTGTILNRDIWGKELEQSINSYIKK